MPIVEVKPGQNIKLKDIDPADLAERSRWDDYMQAFEATFNRCSTAYAPWYIVPANKKWYRNLLISQKIGQTLAGLNLKYPEPAANLDDIVIE